MENSQFLIGGKLKNYNLATNQNGLINIVSKQAIERKANLPAGMRQEVIIDIRVKTVTDAQKSAIIKEIFTKSNNILSATDIGFMTK
ncbi:hypothetical protein PEC311524_23890 [Pectobacterium carotovorum subsp. carotovorum]|nr:hypothetical protein PEC311524_23890 [Pectobacterium carotovorum subsp. carotovorum]